MPQRYRPLIVLAVVVIVAAVLVLSRKGTDEDALKPAFDAEFLTRPDGYDGLREAYDFAFKNEPRQMDPGLMYKACADGAVDVIDAFATDGRIPAYDLKTLEDDKHFFPPYFAAPLIRKDTLEAHPELEEVANMLAGKLPSNTMQHLNYRADEEGLQARKVAREFLVEQGLIEEGAEPGTGEAGRVTVAGKQFTEQEILGELLAILIETHTDLEVRRRLNLGGTMICFNGLKAGDIDLYAEYTGTGLVNILDREVISDPNQAYDVVSKEFDEQYGLRWLDPLGFNNTYTLTMRKKHAAELGIETISDLAAYARGE